MREPWRWGASWAHTVAMGLGCGAAFGLGLAHAAGLVGSAVHELDVSGKLDKAHIFPISPLHLPYISPISPLCHHAPQRRDAGGAAALTLTPP